MNGIALEIHPGGAPPLLFASGWATGAWCWDGLLEDLGGRNETRVLDPRGLGRSTKALADPSSWSMDLALNDLGKAVEGCGAPPVLVGGSISGTLALALAAASPSTVRAVVAIGASPCYFRDESFPLGMTPTEFAAAAPAFEADFESAARTLLPSILLSEGERQESLGFVGRIVDEAAAANDPAFFLGLLGAFLQTDIRSLLPAIRVPILLIHGGQDTCVKPDVGPYLADRLPTARLEMIPGAGHLPHLTRPREVAAAISAFLT